MEKLDCPACGARLLFTDNEYTTVCEYCGQTVRSEQRRQDLSSDELAKKLTALEESQRENTRKNSLNQQLASARSHIAQIQSQILFLERSRSKKAQRQIKQLRVRESQFLREIANIQAEIDPTYSASDQSTFPRDGRSTRKRSTTLVLAIFTGFIGGHRFYTGNFGIGLLQFLTFGGFFIWQLIDIILILTGAYRDAAGRLLDDTQPMTKSNWKLIGMIFGGFWLSGFLLNTLGANPIWLFIGFGTAYILIYQKPVERLRSLFKKNKLDGRSSDGG